MAYAALLSLSQTLDQIVIRDEHTRELEREKLVSLQKYVGALQTFVEEYSHKCKGSVNPLEGRIITVAQHAEDIIEFRYAFHHFFSRFCLADIFQICMMRCLTPLEINSASLHKVLKKMDSILDDAIKIKISNPTKKVSSPSLDSSGSLSYASSDINTMVMEDDFRVIKERIYNRHMNFEAIPIIGMGGIGKSVLARTLYEDSIKQGYFDKYLWVVVSQDYTSKKLFTEILLSMGKPATDKSAIGDLKQVIYQELFGRRYLVVVDDLWSEKPWDDLKWIFSNNTSGSRVLVTTRLSEVASYVGGSSSSNPPHEIQLLNEFHSWALFEERVFGKGSSCLPELEQIGKKMVKSCRGLPLTIVVISGLLKEDTTKEYWETILENICSPQHSVVQHCSEVLSLSYNHLPLYLKPCFLNVAAFPEDYEINVNRLIRLWMAEGFVKQNEKKILEEVAEGYLHSLVGRNLLMVSKKTRYSNRIKTIRIHDILRDFGISTAQQDRFYSYSYKRVRHEYRRVTCLNSYYTLPPLLKFSKPATRSVLMFEFGTGSYSFGNLRLLRVLDAYKADIVGDMSDLVHLRYLFVNSSNYKFLYSLPLRNIQTLIIDFQIFHNYSRDYEFIYSNPEYLMVHDLVLAFSPSDVPNIIVPLKIWTAPSLRHLILSSPGCSLQRPYENDNYEESSLHTMTVRNLQLTKKVCEMLLNLRKLRVSYDHVNESYGLDNLVHLQKLEKLTIRSISSSRSLSFSDLALPGSLKKLSLCDVKGYWKDLSDVGSLPILEALELISFNSNREEGWEPIEDQFLKLKHLKLDSEWLILWEAESVHFPSLQVLVLKDVKYLKEIPCGIGEIDTLEVIELVDCNESIVDSAKRVQAYQWEMGNQSLQLLVATSDHSKDIIYKEIRPEGY